MINIHLVLLREVKQSIFKENNCQDGNKGVRAYAKIHFKIQEEKLKMSDVQKDVCFKITSEANGVYFSALMMIFMHNSFQKIKMSIKLRM